MIRIRAPDKFKARSMIQAAEAEMNFVKTLQVAKQSTSTIIRGVYENFRMLGDALLLIRGKESSGIDHHTEMIHALFTIPLKTTRPIQALLNLKNLRHKINYQGYFPTIDEAQDALSLADACFKPVLEVLKKELEKL